MRKNIILTGLAALALLVALSWASVPTTINDFFLPGSQPGQSGNIEHPDKCDNCHGGYDNSVEPAFNWRGSMMALAARDPLFYACLAIANQDAPGSGDLCIRCHSPSGWLEGRSIPTDGSALNNNDREGVQCDFCHKLVKPTELGVNPYPDDPDYTGESYQKDQDYLATLSNIPPAPGNGMYVVDNDNAKRGPFVDAAAKHQIIYSPFHQEAALCGTCHDVSNPAFVADGSGGYVPNDFDAPAPDFDPYTMFPIERTYSEWLMSAYNTPEGVPSSDFGGNKANVSTCQDCHMRDVSGVACNKRGAIQRDDLPLHDLTGGNTFIPELVKQLYPDEVDAAAIDAGIARATEMLQKAASVEVTTTPQGAGYLVDVKVTNETGHKLPSGYPEGRRIWLNVKAYDTTGSLFWESGAYDNSTGILTHDPDLKIYHIEPGISAALSGDLGLPSGPSFHFVLNHEVFFDNRIPPRGFTNANFESIQSGVVGYSYADGQYWDITSYTLPEQTAQVEVTLFYQTTTKEYVEFLRDENYTNDWGDILYDLWFNNGKSAPVAMNNQTINLQPINGQGPVADFSATPLSGAAPLTVDFTDLSSNSPTGWNWTFGDGGTSSAQSPSYTYNAAGVYTVSLNATNSFGSDTKTVTDYITVTGTPSVALHVNDITVTRITQKGKRESGVATVTVVDAGGVPYAGADVSGAFSGPSTDALSATTDGSGIATFESRKVRNPVGEWCFTVTDIAGAGVTYDAGANVENSDCESGAPVSESERKPSEFVLEGAAPNPFNPTTAIRFSLKSSMLVRIAVYNISGQHVADLMNTTLGAGDHSVRWDASAHASGMYLVRMITPYGAQSRKLSLMK